ncbi:hypothetical protein CERSUDRAFT_116842 [Gelatoporia subvermispora B]|uniref:F-box domain-containing protein n=1 Tax=Ceriporiopsis subvermispora (strain B) TaxID=914234 RepID=M2QCB7_CERS8|nr:hypothetical protein CERSUDRAFT_116842 [Gelatoporia subvermispora B]
MRHHLTVEAARYPSLGRDGNGECLPVRLLLPNSLMTAAYSMSLAYPELSVIHKVRTAFSALPDVSTSAHYQQTSVPSTFILRMDSRRFSSLDGGKDPRRVSAYGRSTSQRRTSQLLTQLSITSEVFRISSPHKRRLHTASPPSRKHRRSPAVPFEICERVIHFVAHPIDRPSLVACALVCRAWLSTSRRHLFHIVHLRTVPQIEFLSQILNNFRGLRDLIGGLVVCPSDEDAPDVLRRSLCMLSHMPSGTTFSVSPLSPSLSSAFLPKTTRPSLFSRRKKIQPKYRARLSLEGLTWNAPNTFSTLPKYSSVTSLSLCCNSYTNFSDLLPMLSQFPELQYLHCCSLSCLDCPSSESLNPRSFHGMLNKLRRMEVHTDTLHSQQIQQLLDASGTTLEILSLHTRSDRVLSRCSEDSSFTPDLGRFTALHTISLGSELHHTEGNLSWMNDVLETSSSSALKQIALRLPRATVDFATQRRRRSSPMALRLEEVLTNSQFGELERILFMLQSFENCETSWFHEVSSLLQESQSSEPALVDVQLLDGKLQHEHTPITISGVTVLHPHFRAFRE